MEDLGKDVFKQENKEAIRFFRKLPKPIRRILFGIRVLLEIAGAIGLIGLGTKALAFNIHISNILGAQISNIAQNQKADNGGTVINYFGTSDECLNCSNFKDGRWNNTERFKKISDDPLTLKSPNSLALPGAVMFYSKNVKNFTMQAILTPQATVSANLLVQYGNFSKCIIGDANYSYVSCRVNIAYGSSVNKEVWSYIDKEGALHGNIEQHQISYFEPNQDLQLRYEIKNYGQDRILSIKINDQVPLEWKLPKQFANKDQSDKVGIGLFTTKYDDVQAVFKQFQLDPHI